MNRDLIYILVIGCLFWAGVFLFKHYEKPTIHVNPVEVSTPTPVENCFITDDQFLICKLKES